MKVDRGVSNDWQEISRRIAVYVVVISLHLGMLMILLRGAVSPWRESFKEARSAHDILNVRFIAVSASATPKVVKAFSRATVRTSPVRMRERSMPRKVMPAGNPPVVAAEPDPGAATPWDTRSDAQSAVVAGGSGYMAGGDLLRGVTKGSRPGDHLPGSDQAIVAGIQLTDPKKQGARNVVHRLQELFGVPDHHCVDVDAWRGMSIQELVDLHISPEDVQRTAEEHKCY
jgi:hypothetical protein